MSKMSKVSNSVDSASKYIAFLATIPHVKRVLLAGSRSPLRSKQHTKTSDWDLVVVTDTPSLRFANPRTTNQLHADLLIVQEDKAHLIPKTVELYPTDEKKVLM